VCSTSKFIKEKTQICLKLLEIMKKQQHIHSQHILHGDSLYNFKKKEIPDGLCRIGICQSRLFDEFFFHRIFLFSLFAMQLDYCNIQRVHDQR